MPKHEGWAVVAFACLMATSFALPSAAQTAPVPAGGAASEPPVQAAPVATGGTAPTGNTSDHAIAGLVARQHDPFGRSCQLQHVTGDGALRFLACGAAGLWIVRLSGDEATLVETRDLGGRVGPFFQANGRLWVEVTTVRAQEVGGASDSPLPAANPTPPPSAAAVATSNTARALPSVTEEPAAAGRVVEQADERGLSS